MPRPKAQAPAISYHLSGQAITKFDGVTFYLGKHNSAESFAKYAVLVRAYQDNGFKLPDEMTPECIRNLDIEPAKVQPVIDLSKEPVCVKHVTDGYVAYCETYYQNDPEALRKIKRVCEDVRKHAGDVEAKDFGPVLLKEVREKWVKTGVSRRYVNTLTNLVFRMFKWAVSAEKVSVDVHRRLKTLPPLLRGRTTAKEGRTVKPVNIAHVRATAEKLSPTLRAMLRVQLGTGMRPSELCIMRPCDIDRTGPEWLYIPSRHKNTNKDKERIIPILGDARSALEDYMNRGAKSFCFSPKESVAWHNTQKRAARQSKVQPSQMDRSKENPAVTPGDCYTKDSYRRALQRAAKEAGVPQWTPYEIRHLVGTMVAEALQLENAKALLGHSDLATTQRYSQATVRQAVAAAQVMPKL
ncbi:MAG: tyrosine-type recombinase/integrase [Pirellula sp.]|jgi:integrase